VFLSSYILRRCHALISSLLPHSSCEHRRQIDDGRSQTRRLPYADRHAGDLTPAFGNCRDHPWGSGEVLNHRRRAGRWRHSRPARCPSPASRPVRGRVCLCLRLAAAGTAIFGISRYSCTALRIARSRSEIRFSDSLYRRRRFAGGAHSARSRRHRLQAQGLPVPVGHAQRLERSRPKKPLTK
jgi:hypothetical protein